MPHPDAGVGTELVSVKCPRCQSGYSAEVTTIVDAADDAARTALLGGSVNVLSCPACGHASRVATPMLYLDREAELAFVLVPDALGLNLEDQEQRIGQLTNRAVNALPSDERRMYMLQPRAFVSESSFFEAVLEANGVSPTEVERIQDTARLIEALLGAEDADELSRRLEAAGRAPDQELVALTHALARDATAQGDTVRATGLEALRDMLATILGPTSVSLDELLVRLREARDAGQLPEAAAALAPVLDYTFYTQLTERIDSAQTDEERDELTSLRTELVAASDAAELRARAEFERGLDSVRAVLGTADQRQALKIRLPALDSAFFQALQATLQEASQRGDEATAREATQLLDLAIELVESAMPPLNRLVNQLARAGDGQERTELLNAHADLVSDELETALRSAAFQMRTGGAAAQADALESAAQDVSQRIRAAGQVST